RGPPIFARNKAGAQLLNIAHGLFPSAPLSEAKLAALIRWLNTNVKVEHRRTLAGGLVKFEPSVAMKIRVPGRLTQQQCFSQAAVSRPWPPSATKASISWMRDGRSASKRARIESSPRCAVFGRNPGSRM